MSVFRDPRYLDVNRLQPFASHHGVETDATVAVTVRDAEGTNTGGGASVNVPAAGALNFGHTRTGDNEVVQNQTYSTHPVSALNTLLDTLAETSDPGLLQDIPENARKRMYLECEREWSVSPATEMGGIVSSVFGAFLHDPAAMQEGGDSKALMAQVLGNGHASSGPIVLESSERDDQDRAIVVLLDGGNLRPGTELPDLEEELIVFGQIDSVIADGTSYSLERFLVPNMNREFRRQIDMSDQVGQLAQKMGRDWDSSAIQVEGPAVVIRPIAVY